MEILGLPLNFDLTHLIPIDILIQMVFGWGKKKEPEYQAPQTEDVPLSQVQDKVSDLLELRKSQTISEFIAYRDHVLPLLEEISHIGRALEEDNLNVDDIDRNIRVIVVRGKKQVIDVIKKDIVELPKISNIDDVMLFQNVLNQILKKIGDALGRQTRVIHIFAKKYAAKLKEILAEVNTINADLKKLLENLENYTTSSTEITDYIDEISELKKFNSDAVGKISSLNDDFVACNEKITSCEESIKAVKSSSEYTELLKQKEMLDNLKLQRTRLNSRVLDQFTKISRPLGRYEYSSSLDKEQKSLLSGLIESPSKVLTAQNKDTILIIFENVKKGITSGSISVKDKTKALSLLEYVEKSLDGLILEISEQDSRQEKVNALIIHLTPSELPLLEKDLDKTTYNKSVIESKIHSLESEMSKNEKEIPYLIHDIESTLRRFSNTRYTIIGEN